MYLAQLKGLKTIAYAQGIGPIKTAFIQWLTKQVLQKCDRISVRDQGSAQLLKQWGLDYIIAADPVWALPSKIKQELNLLPSPRIAVNLRAHYLLTPDKIQILSEALVELQQKTQANIILVPFQKSQDLPVCQEIARKLSPNCQIIEIENPQELKGLWSNMDMMIGMRLHSIIMAVSEECPCFALSYDPKVTNLMQEINLSGYELSNFPTQVTEITQSLLEFYVNKWKLSSNIIESLAQNALQHQSLIDSQIN